MTKITTREINREVRIVKEIYEYCPTYYLRTIHNLLLIIYKGRL